MDDPQPDLGDARRNWREWEGPLSDKVRLVVRNNLTKARTRANCCGNHGEPGC